MPHTAPTVFSFFSGAGFLDLGFERSGFNVSFVNEVHAPFVRAYQYSRQQMGMPEPQHGYFVDDINRLLTPQGLHDLQGMATDTLKAGGVLGFIGGPPCPDFSVGGKNKGQTGENGKLSQSYVDLICAIRPTFFMFENVKGLWRTARHRAFYEALKVQLRAAGYLLTERLINAIEYGAAQDRDRIILFGVQTSSLRNAGMTPPQLTAAFAWEAHLKFPGRSAFSSFHWPSTEGSVWQEDCTTHPAVPQELTVAYWFERNRVSTHPNQVDHFQPRAGLAKFQTILEGDVSKKSYKRLHRFRYSPTAAYGNNEVHIHPTAPRRITVAEALAIQSLPPEFCLPPKMTLTDKFKTIGNGVPFVAALGLASTIRVFLEENVCESNGRKSGESDQQVAPAKVVRIHQRTIRDKSTGDRRHIA